MFKIEASLHRLVYDSKRFFQNTRYFHIVMGALMLGTGIAGLVLSLGSNGTAKVPYYFSAFVSGVWHFVFLTMCQVCVYFLSDDGKRSSGAGPWIHAYSIVSSVFVLFNVMGVVFTVVNGMCIEAQMCYYDKNMAANRAMAILLVIEHIVSVVFSVFFAKRSHLIDSQLNEDVGIKLKIPLDFIHFRSRKRTTNSATSVNQSAESQSEQSSNSDNKEPGLSNVQVKGGETLTTIEISAMSRKMHRRSKSQPNMFKLGLKDPFDGQVVSIYSDSEAKVKANARKKKRMVTPRKKSNRVEAIVHISGNAKITTQSGQDSDNELSDDDDLSSLAGTSQFSVEETKVKLGEYKKQRDNIKPLSDSCADDDSDNILLVKPVSADETYERQQAILQRQEQLQRKQEQLLKEQREMFLVQKERMKESSVNISPPQYEELFSQYGDQQSKNFEQQNKFHDDNEDVVI